MVKRGIDDDHDDIPDGEFTGSEKKQENPLTFSTVFVIKYVY